MWAKMERGSFINQNDPGPWGSLHGEERVGQQSLVFVKGEKNFDSKSVRQSPKRGTW